MFILSNKRTDLKLFNGIALYPFFRTKFLITYALYIHWKLMQRETFLQQDKEQEIIKKSLELYLVFPCIHNIRNMYRDKMRINDNMEEIITMDLIH